MTSEINPNSKYFKMLHNPLSNFFLTDEQIDYIDIQTRFINDEICLLGWLSFSDLTITRRRLYVEHEIKSIDDVYKTKGDVKRYIDFLENKHEELKCIDEDYIEYSD